MSDEERREDSGGGNNAVAAKIIFGIALLPLLPAAIFGWLMFFVVFRIFKQKPSVASLISLFFVAIGFVTIAATKAVPRFLDTFKNIFEIGQNWGELMPLIVGVNIVVGSIVGLGIILWEAKGIKDNPHRTKLPGLWSYEFEYRKTPWELYKKKKAIESLREGEMSDDTKAALGYNEAADKVEYRYFTDARKHTIISGASGSGKTITMLQLMLADIQAGRSVVAIDFKRSEEFASKLAQWAEEHEINFYHFEQGKPSTYSIPHSPGQASYDPFASGSGGNMLMGMREYTAEANVYKQAMQQTIAIIFNMLKHADWNSRYVKDIDRRHGMIYLLRSVLTPGNLQNLMNACAGTEVEQDAYEFMQEVTSKRSTNLQKSVEELRGSLRTMTNSEYGMWLKKNPERHIDLLKLLTSDTPCIVLFSFKADDDKELSNDLGSMIFADLMAVSSKARMQQDGLRNGVSVYADEFQAVPPNAVTGLLEKARSSNMSVTLAMQSYEQVITSAKSNGEAYLGNILVTCSTFVTHAGMTEPAAERISSIVGKKKEITYRQTNKSSGGFLSNNFSNKRDQMVSTSEETKAKVPPNVFLELAAPSERNGYKSEAIIVTKSPSDSKESGAVARKVWMIPDGRVLEPIDGVADDAPEPDQSPLAVLEDYDDDFASPQIALDDDRAEANELEEVFQNVANIEEPESEDGWGWDTAPVEEEDSGIEEDYEPTVPASALSYEDIDKNYKPLSLKDMKSSNTQQQDYEDDEPLPDI